MRRKFLLLNCPILFISPVLKTPISFLHFSHELISWVWADAWTGVIVSEDQKICQIEMVQLKGCCQIATDPWIIVIHSVVCTQHWKKWSINTATLETYTQTHNTHRQFFTYCHAVQKFFCELTAIAKNVLHSAYNRKGCVHVEYKVVNFWKNI